MILMKTPEMPEFIDICIIYIYTPNVSDADEKGMEHRPKYVDEVIVGLQFEVNQVSLRIYASPKWPLLSSHKEICSTVPH